MKYIDKSGNNYSVGQVVEIINKATGSNFTCDTFMQAYRVGSIYQNGSIWFQRLI